MKHPSDPVRFSSTQYAKKQQHGRYDEPCVFLRAGQFTLIFPCNSIAMDGASLY